LLFPKAAISSTNTDDASYDDENKSGQHRTQVKQSLCMQLALAFPTANFANVTML
jgi:hypothetical protein